MGEGRGYCQGAGGGALVFAMDSKDERARRLAEALRANLRRRKAQARDSADAPPPPTPAKDR